MAMQQQQPSPDWIAERVSQFQTLYKEQQDKGEHGRFVLNEGNAYIALRKLVAWIYHDPKNPHDPKHATHTTFI